MLNPQIHFVDRTDVFCVKGGGAHSNRSAVKGFNENVMWIIPINNCNNLLMTVEM
jgi:hypothetical protein